MELKINGQRINVSVEDDTPLLWALREGAGMTGTKYGCGVAQCGACTVWIDGQPIRSCVTPASVVQGRDITTIEAIERDPVGRKVVQAWVAHQVPQCGYCQSGMLMAAAALLDKTPKPTDADIDAAMTNLCRCGTYQRVRRAIHRAAAAGGKP